MECGRMVEMEVEWTCRKRAGGVVKAWIGCV